MIRWVRGSVSVYIKGSQQTRVCITDRGCVGRAGKATMTTTTILPVRAMGRHHAIAARWYHVMMLLMLLMLMMVLFSRSDHQDIVVVVVVVVDEMVAAVVVAVAVAVVVDEEITVVVLYLLCQSSRKHGTCVERVLCVDRVCVLRGCVLLD